MPRLPLREVIPQRDLTIPVKSSYRDYIDQLRIDFNSRCGYCDSFDKRRTNDFEIDHFVPKKVFEELKPNDYHNLVYACKSCNRSKSGKWPSNNEKINVVDNTGFIDPCKNDYDLNFSRDDNGEIDWVTDHGKWMYKELSLFNPEHSILWKLEKLMRTIQIGIQLSEEKPDNIKIIKGLNALFLIQESYLNLLFDAK